MARPHRPNVIGPQVAADGINCKARLARRSGSQKQETRREMKIRKRAEAEARNLLTRPEDRRAARLAAARAAA